MLTYWSSLEDLSSDSTFHTLSWASHKSEHPLKPVTSAESLAAQRAMKDAKVLVKAIEELLCTKVKLVIVIDSKDHFTTTSTCTLAYNRSIRGYVNSIRFKFATKMCLL